ncbi:MAG: transglutaminase-like domain-containing protein [Candidatus Hydrogenedentota bacterium]
MRVVVGLWVAAMTMVFAVGTHAQGFDVEPFLGEEWYGLYMTGKKIGYSSSTVSQGDAGRVTVVEDAVFRLNMVGVKQEMRIFSKRTYGIDGGLVSIESTVEDVSGASRFEAYVGAESMTLRSRVGGQETMKTFPKPSETLKDMIKIVDLIANNPKVGDSVTFSVFEPMYQMEIDGRITILGKEERMFGGVMTEVYRVKSEMTLMGIESEGFMTADGLMLEDTVAGGVITMRLEPKEVAMDVQYTNDTIVSNAALVDSPISKPRTRESLKLRVKGPLTEDVLFNDERQSMSKRVDSYTFEGKKISLDGYDAATLPIDEPSVAEWQAASLFVQSDNAKMQERAKSIVGDETNAAAVSEAICHWVSENMHATFSARLTNSLEVLENMEGDCTEHSMLFIGLARAAGLPAREVAGLIYVEGPKPGFYFHQWAKVWIGKWVEVDPTFDQPIADATHIKLAEGDLFEQTKILPVIGQLSIEVLE